MTLEELKKLIAGHESERVELKEWKPSVPFDGQEKFENRKCVLGYCVALGNEGGGYLVIGVNDKKEIVGTSARLGDDIKKKDITNMLTELRVAGRIENTSKGRWSVWVLK